MLRLQHSRSHVVLRSGTIRRPMVMQIGGCGRGTGQKMNRFAVSDSDSSSWIRFTTADWLISRLQFLSCHHRHSHLAEVQRHTWIKTFWILRYTICLQKGLYCFNNHKCPTLFCIVTLCSLFMGHELIHPTTRRLLRKCQSVRLWRLLHRFCSIFSLTGDFHCVKIFSKFLAGTALFRSTYKLHSGVISCSTKNPFHWYGLVKNCTTIDAYLSTHQMWITMMS